LQEADNAESAVNFLFAFADIRATYCTYKSDLHETAPILQLGRACVASQATSPHSRPGFLHLIFVDLPHFLHFSEQVRYQIAGQYHSISQAIRVSMLLIRGGFDVASAEQSLPVAGNRPDSGQWPLAGYIVSRPKGSLKEGGYCRSFTHHCNIATTPDFVSCIPKHFGRLSTRHID
jgi:hypothetical protein